METDERDWLIGNPQDCETDWRALHVEEEEDDDYDQPEEEPRRKNPTISPRLPFAPLSRKIGVWLWCCTFVYKKSRFLFVWLLGSRSLSYTQFCVLPPHPLFAKDRRTSSWKRGREESVVVSEQRVARFLLTYT